MILKFWRVVHVSYTNQSQIKSVMGVVQNDISKTT